MEELETMYMLKRKGRFLNERYQWSPLPHSFPEWQFSNVLQLAMMWKDRPLEVGEIEDGNVDNVVWVKLP